MAEQTPPPLKPLIDQGRSYEEAMHAMQTGVGYWLEGHGITTTAPVGKMLKDIRVGLNSEMVNNGALLNVLVAKNLITVEEFGASLRLLANNEAAMWERIVSQLLGRDVKLG